jgi:hypothetical protein
MSAQNKDTGQAEPRASRPTLPKGYGIPDEILPWSFARGRLDRAQNYWICSVSASGKPHATPLWGVWLDDRLYFEGSPLTRWGRNITANPHMTVHLEDANQAVIVEGTVEDVMDVGEELYKRVTDVYAAKYNNYRPEDHGFFVFRPQVAFGWRQFPQSATRWRFE